MDRSRESLVEVPPGVEARRETERRAWCLLCGALAVGTWLFACIAVAIGVGTAVFFAAIALPFGLSGDSLWIGALLFSAGVAIALGVCLLVRRRR